MKRDLLIREILRVADQEGHGALSSAIVQPLQKFGHAFFNGRQWEFHEEVATLGIHTASSEDTTVFGPGTWSVNVNAS